MEEYLKRNLVVAKAYGVRSGLVAIADRMRKRKDCPEWLIKIATAEINKMHPIIETLIKHREEIEHD